MRGLPNAIRSRGLLAVVAAAGCLGGSGCGLLAPSRPIGTVEIDVPAELAAQVLAFVARETWPEADGEPRTAGAPLRAESCRFHLRYAQRWDGRVSVDQNLRVSPLGPVIGAEIEFTERLATRALGAPMLDLTVQPISRSSCRVRFEVGAGSQPIEPRLRDALALLGCWAELRDRLERGELREAATIADHLPAPSVTTATPSLRRLRQSLAVGLAEVDLDTGDAVRALRALRSVGEQNPNDLRVSELQRRALARLRDHPRLERSLRRTARMALATRDRWRAQIELDAGPSAEAAEGQILDSRARRLSAIRSVRRHPDRDLLPSVQRSLGDHRAALAARLAATADRPISRAEVVELVDDALNCGDGDCAARLLARHWHCDPAGPSPELRRRFEICRGRIGSTRLLRIAISEGCSEWLDALEPPREGSAMARSFERSREVHLDQRSVDEPQPTGTRALPASPR